MLPRTAANTMVCYIVIAGGRSNRTVLASYSQLAVLKDWQLIWSTTPILDTGRLLPPTLASPLGLRSPPPFAAIQQHLLKVFTIKAKQHGLT